MNENIALSKLNYVNLKNGQFDSTTVADMGAMFQAMKDDENGNNIVVHFHGGLVNEQAGMKTAQKLLCTYQKADAYPVFFVWEAGLFEVIGHNLKEISQEKIFKKILTKVTKYALAKLTDDGESRGTSLVLRSEDSVQDALGKIQDGHIPFADFMPNLDSSMLSKTQRKQFVDELKDDGNLDAMVQEIANGLQAPKETKIAGTRGISTRVSAVTLMSPEVLGPMQKSSDSTARGLFTTARIVKGALSILTKVLLRFIKGTDHGLHATVVEEILREFYLANVGEAVWSTMKQDTADAFGDDLSKHGGTAFIEELRKLHAEGKKPRVSLVGHSTGAVYISYFLKKAHEMLPADFKFNVVYLAPAVTFKLLAKTINECGDRIALFRSFGMTDQVEKADQLVPVLYPHSLLYFVSGVVESEVDMPLVGMERYYAATGPYVREDIIEVKNFLEDRNISQIWSITDTTAEEGFRTASESHGGFDDDDDTMKSVQAILRD